MVQSKLKRRHVTEMNVLQRHNPEYRNTITQNHGSQQMSISFILRLRERLTYLLSVCVCVCETVRETDRERTHLSGRMSLLAASRMKDSPPPSLGWLSAPGPSGMWLHIISTASVFVFILSFVFF